jgi:threonylcarbamoyladenosine tRNA methylthiotransferase MtaB
VDTESGADVVVINTCSVTENADKECKTIVKRALQANPDSFIVVTGCYAQLKPEEIASLPGVDLVLGATEKFRISEYLNNFTKKRNAEIHSCTIGEADFFVSSYSAGERTRAFLKVQDGCDYSCTYCTIPLARGKSRSDTIPNATAMAVELAQKGIREIVLTGVNLGDFSGEGKEHSAELRYSFLDLIRELDKVEGIERFRISSIEPNLLRNEIISFVANSEKFVPHFHVPLQSGSDKILGLMKRRYRREHYTGRVKEIRRQMPHACIGADVIVGFPGETDEDFLETFSFLKDLDVSYLHVFTYSERENTEAASMQGKVPMSVRKEHNQMLRILSEKKLRSFYESQSGMIYPVLVEADYKNGMMHGFTPNYVKVSLPYDSSLINQIIRVELQSINATELSMNSQFVPVLQ